MPTKAQPPSFGLRGGLQGGPGTWAVPIAASQEAQQQGVGVEYRVPPTPANHQSFVSGWFDGNCGVAFTTARNCGPG